MIEARRHLERALDFIHADPDPRLAGAFEVDPAAFARCFLALDLCLLGEGDAADAVMHEALAAARQRSGPFSLSFSLCLAASQAVLRGDPQGAHEHADEALAVATKHGYVLTGANATTLLAWADSELGAAEGAPKRIKDALAAAARTGAAQWRHFFLALLAQALGRRHRPRAALATLEYALAHAVATGERFYEAEVHRIRAEVLLAVAPEANRPEAEAALQRAASVARSQRSQLLLERAERALLQLQ